MVIVYFKYLEKKFLKYCIGEEEQFVICFVILFWIKD